MILNQAKLTAPHATADDAKVHIVHLIVRRGRNKPPDDATTNWIDKRADEIHGWLAAIGLVEGWIVIDMPSTTLTYMRAYIKSGCVGTTSRGTAAVSRAITQDGQAGQSGKDRSPISGTASRIGRSVFARGAKRQLCSGRVYHLALRDTETNLRTTSGKIADRRRTELERTGRFANHVLNKWFGHTGAIAEAHYLQVTEDDYTQATSTISGGTFVGTTEDIPELSENIKVAENPIKKPLLVPVGGSESGYLYTPLDSNQ